MFLPRLRRGIHVAPPITELAECQSTIYKHSVPMGLIVITILLTKLEATLSFHSGHYLVSSSR